MSDETHILILEMESENARLLATIDADRAASPVPLDAALLTRAMERAMSAVDDEWTIPEFADITAAEYAALATPDTETAE